MQVYIKDNHLRKGYCMNINYFEGWSWFREYGLYSPINDNDESQDWKSCKQLNDNWHQYDEIKMTIRGPIGITKAGFVYLDPEIAAWRG